MQKPNKQNDHKGVFTPLTRPKVSDPKAADTGQVDSKKLFAGTGIDSLE